jgi:hypothetical protein
MPRLQAISVGVGFACFAAAAIVTGALIPASMRPRFAWPLASEWLVFTFCMLLAAWFTVGGMAACIPSAHQRMVVCDPWLDLHLLLPLACDHVAYSILHV